MLGGIPKPEQGSEFEYYIIPSKDMAKNIKNAHQAWLKTPAKKGQEHKDNTVRSVAIPPKKSFGGLDIQKYKNRWDLIAKKLT